jgi:hypothetical protein
VRAAAEVDKRAAAVHGRGVGVHLNRN